MRDALVRTRPRVGVVTTLAAVSAAMLATACGPGSSASHATSPSPGLGQGSPQGSPGQVLAAYPLPAESARALPAGVFYLFAGPVSDRWASVWEIQRGRQILLTRGNAGRAVDLFGASAAGVIVSDNANFAAGLARWTRTGPVWLHPAGNKRLGIAGQAPSISQDGTIAYMLPSSGANGSEDSVIRVRSSWAGPDRIVYRSGTGGSLIPVFGPRGMIAVATVGQTLPLRRPDVVVLRGHDVVLRLHSGFTRLGLPQIWGPQAPALALNSAAGDAELLYLSGRHEPLPVGWKALAWDPSRRMLLIEKRHAIGIWSMTRPGLVKIIGALNSGFHIFQAYWLASPARL